MTDRDPLRLTDPASGAPDALRSLFVSGANDLPTDAELARLSAKLGPLLVRVERAVDSVGGIGRVHVCRWGDGSEHLHFWFMARPARMPQLKGSFAAIWDDMLPPVPDEIRHANLAIVARELVASGGRSHI